MKKVRVSTNRRSAVALSYKGKTRAPKVVAKGYGDLAERIIERAHEVGVFVHDAPELVTLLMQVELDQLIPPELYRAVSEVLAFVCLLEQQAAGTPDRLLEPQPFSDGLMSPLLKKNNVS